MAMDAAHSTFLNDLIKEVCDVGAVRITERRLLRCFGAKNVAKAIWRDLQQRFEDETEARIANGEHWQGYSLDALRAYDGITLVVQQPRNIPRADKKNRWWAPVAELAGVPMMDTVVTEPAVPRES